MARTPKALLLSGATLLLAATAGCSTSASTYADLENAPVVEKPLPTDLDDHALEGFDVDATRWVGEYGGAQLWLGPGVDEYEVCLLYYTEAQEWGGACSGGGGISSTGIGNGLRYAVVPDGEEPRRGATQVSQNVYATGA
ncbi:MULTISPECIES: hypothetical protein [unclassified Pseudoclavibacter]|uniref:hypothetical protein n=1 Tax=unclassified Pseudoclavibacter TaxID=2615177 RepID=UPI000CE8B94F|nr:MULTISPECIES: hypothetical protein [unclassified Pseudoclavibacter]NYF14793.1 hypothetical protein [Pseudoclavibacter sp. JAI123]PPG32707.1 hypothetical protein C5B97_02795 [Pseudoclavibacter sp. RFBB5]